MPRAAPIILAFNGGELSPLLDSRVDVERYSSGCRQLRNWLCLIQGAATRRPGTNWYGVPKFADRRAWLIPFIFSKSDAYQLEVGHNYIRFWTRDGQVEASPGVPLEVSSPWTEEMLITDDGTCAIQVEQSFDVLYMVGGGQQPRKLSRLSALDWTLTQYEPKDGPFLDKNRDPAITIYASATTGTAVTLTASAPIFEAGHDEALIRLWEQNPADIQPWRAGVAITANALRRSDGKVYRATTSADTGADKPVHEEGTGTDGGVTWLYLHAGYGVARIKTVTDATTVTASVQSRLPDTVVGSGNATSVWEFGAWSEVAGYPEAVGFYRERLSFGAGRRLWQTPVDDFESMRDRTSAEVLADDGLALTINGSQVNRIAWIKDDQNLGIGMDRAEYAIRKITEGEPYGADNVEAVPATAYGSRRLQPVKCHDRTLFVDRSGRRLREFVYRYETDRFSATDLTRVSEHITRATIVAMAWQGTEDILWAALADGTLAAFSYDPDQQVAAWHSHELGGGLMVESVSCIPAPDGADELWLMARIGEGEDERRWMLRMDRVWQFGNDRADARFLDGALLYEGAPETEIVGLGHLDGLTVDILADGAVQQRQVVTGGAVTLEREASKVYVGLPVTFTLEPMLLEAGAADGTAQGKEKRISEVRFRVMDTRGLRVSGDGENWESLDKRSPSTPMGQPQPLASGLIRVKPWPGSWEEDARIIVEGDGPLPATLVAIMPKVTTSS